MKRTIIALMSIVLVLFAFSACRPTTVIGVPVNPDGGNNNNGGENPGSGETTPVELPASDLAVVQSAVKAVFDAVTENTARGSWHDDNFEGEYFYSTDNGWSLTAWGDRKEEATNLLSKASTHDIEFVITSENLTEGSDIIVHLNGAEYTVDSTLVADTVSFEWNINARLAKHGSTFDGYADNSPKVSSVEYSDNVITVTGILSEMREYESTDKTQGKGKWIALLIKTGEDTLTNVLYNGKPLTDQDVSDREAMLAIDDPSQNNVTSTAADDEFVIWLKANEIANNEKTITLGHAGVSDEEIVIKFVVKSGDDPEESVNPGDDPEKDPEEVVPMPGGEDDKEEQSPIEGDEEGTDIMEPID